MSMYEELFSVYTGILVPVCRFLVPGRGSFASTCRDSSGEVLKAPVYILMHSLCMLSSFFNRPVEAVLYIWQP